MIMRVSVAVPDEPLLLYEANDPITDSKRVLPTIYNTKLDERERKSRELLQDLLEASPTRGKKR
jgi:hypothetical protein